MPPSKKKDEEVPKRTVTAPGAKLNFVDIPALNENEEYTIERVIEVITFSKFKNLLTLDDKSFLKNALEILGVEEAVYIKDSDMKDLRLAGFGQYRAYILGQAETASGNRRQSSTLGEPVELKRLFDLPTNAEKAASILLFRKGNALFARKVSDSQAMPHANTIYTQRVEGGSQSDVDAVPPAVLQTNVTFSHRTIIRTHQYTRLLCSSTHGLASDVIAVVRAYELRYYDLVDVKAENVKTISLAVSPILKSAIIDWKHHIYESNVLVGAGQLDAFRELVDEDQEAPTLKRVVELVAKLPHALLGLMLGWYETVVELFEEYNQFPEQMNLPKAEKDQLTVSAVKYVDHLGKVFKDAIKHNRGSLAGCFRELTKVPEKLCDKEVQMRVAAIQNFRPTSSYKDVHNLLDIMTDDPVTGSHTAATVANSTCNHCGFLGHHGIQCEYRKIGYPPALAKAIQAGDRESVADAVKAYHSNPNKEIYDRCSKLLGALIHTSNDGKKQSVKLRDGSHLPSPIYH